MPSNESPTLRARLIEAERSFAARDDASVTQACQWVLGEWPEHPGALTLLGAVAHRAGDMAGAASYFARAEAAAPGDPRALVNHGVALLALGQTDAAATKLEQAVGSAPDSADAWFNYGRALQELGRVASSRSAYERAVSIAPTDIQALNNLGAMLQREGRIGDAVRVLGHAVRLRPTYALGLLNLANALGAAGQHADAATCLRRVLALAPGHPTAPLQLAHELRAGNDYEEAERQFRAVIARQPDDSNAWAGLGLTLGGLRRLRDAEAALRRAIELNPADVGPNDDLLVALNYRGDVTHAERLSEHRAWAKRHAEPLKAAWRPHANVRDPDRPLRIGFISGNFRRHPVAYFLLRLLESLDREQFRVTCYSTRPRSDEFTDRVRAAAERWVETTEDDAQLAERVRADSIDVLIDQDGHYAGNRLLVFARKPAPVQATWHGYPMTTGMDAIDWIISDRHQCPPEAEPFLVERVYRLPDDTVTYEPPAYAPPVTALPAATSGTITFAAFHTPSKIGDDCAALWARVLAALPGSRIVFKYAGINTPSTRAAMAAVFARHGVDATRLVFDPASPHVELLRRYGDCDIALDSVPYSGSTTTCEALWMGVPVVTRPTGQMMFERHTLAHLTMVGLPELVARDDEGFVSIAVDLARDLPRLAELRRGLRERMASSPLCDGPRFARAFGDALRTMWRDWLDRTANA